MRLNQKEVRRLFDYDPETGVLIHKTRSGVRAAVGQEAGWLRPDGYRMVSIKGHPYRAHRVIWLYVYGYLPEHVVDHKNGVRDANWLLNLRHNSQGCNLQNSNVRSDNISTFPGVGFDRRNKKWMAYACLQNKSIYLGRYSVALNAALARLTWEIQCPKWTCNYRSELVKAIKRAWPEFKIN